MKIAILSITGLFILGAAVAQPQSPDNETMSKENKKESKIEKHIQRKIEGVSNESIEAFSIDFPKATDISWTRSENFDEASFTDKNGVKVTAYYDDENKLVGTTQYVTFDAVPQKGQDEIKKRYKDYTVGKVVFFDDNEANESDMILWASQFDDADNYFVELTKGKDSAIVKVDTHGLVSFFKQL